jgi:hypothetical protein
MRRATLAAAAVVLFVPSAAVHGTATNPPPGPVDDAALQAARAGLGRIVATMPNAAIEPSAPLGPCPLVDAETVDDELAAAGVDAPLAGWSRRPQPVGPYADVIVACEGVHVGVDEDAAFPELRLDVVAMDLGDAATAEAALRDELGAAGAPLLITGRDGGTIGACANEDRAVRCSEWWHHDALVFGVEIVDRVYVDRPTASTLLGGIVPAVVATLAASATDVADPLRAVTRADVDAATAALGAFVDAHPDALTSERERLDCPLVDAGALEPSLADAGLDWTLGGWAASIAPVTYPRDLDPLPIRVSCTNRAGSVTLDAITFGDAGDAADFVASVGGAEGGSGSDLAPGDLTVGSCTSAGGARYCNEWWRSDALVIGVTLFSDPSSPDHRPIGPDDAATILADLVPSVLAALSG